ncbi:LacI family DNA-binding transcriptional regulator [Alloscardovia venturai]|uniref:LacI family DNA-binding transcriptional regulator n=1 Tax=Alloscardovia venturai TaxID=1769421 RepID=A0ABW2Y3P0_9BIFI
MTSHSSHVNSQKQLSDIAEETGYSIATVSKVLNGRSDVAPETREVITHALKQAHYARRTNLSAKSSYIEVVLQSYDTVWSLEVLRSVLNSAKPYGLSVIATESGDRTHPDSDWINGVIRRAPYGVILVFSKLTSVEHKKLDEHHIPYVILDPAGNPNAADYSVQADDWTGGLAATRHLIELGHTRIGILTGPMSMLCSRARFDGYKAALDEAHLDFDPSVVREGTFNTLSSFKPAMSLLSQENRPSAIFGSSDLQCMALYEAARRLNISIPNDLSIVGFDDIQSAQFLSPQLTTVRQPIDLMAQSALEMISAQQKHQKTLTKRAILPTRLVVRDSTQTFIPQNTSASTPDSDLTTVCPHDRQ